MQLAAVLVVAGCLLASSAQANLLCSGSDKTCQEYLPDSDFYAQSKSSNYVFDYFSRKAKASGITSNKFPDSGILVTLSSPSDIPTTQLPGVDFSVLYWWMPKASVSMPHYHGNAVEWGFVTKGMGYACMADMSKGSDGVAATPETSTYRFICNKLKVGEMYLVPAGWLHFLFYPCKDAELVFGFNKVDYETVNVVNAFEVPIPQSKYAPGPGVTVEEMDDIIAWVNDAQEGYVYGDSHLYMGSANGAQKFCAKYPA